MVLTTRRVLLAGALGLLLAVGCSQPPAATPVPARGGADGSRQPSVAATAAVAVPVATPAEVTPARRAAPAGARSYAGNVQARQQVQVMPKVAGRVTKLPVDVGSAVKAGDVLVELDRDALAAQVAQAEAGLAAAQARLSGLEAGPRSEQVGQAEANLKAAQGRLDQLKAGPTEHQIAAAEAQVRLARNQLYLAQAQGDAALSSRLPTTYTRDQKEAQSGIAWEQIQLAEANLASMKAGPTVEQLAQSEAAVEAAQQQLALARRPVTRYDLDAARAAVAQAKAALDLARVQLAEATIRAPFPGVVAQRAVAEGALVGPAAPVLTLISRETEVVVNVEEGSLAAVSAGQAATVTAGAYPGREFMATVSTIAPSVDVKSRTVAVRLTPNDAEGKLREGMFVEVTIQ